MASSRPSRRPRFELRTACAPTEVRARVDAMLRSSPRMRGIAFDHRLEIAVDGAEHHFWSPQIVATIEPDGGGARLHCRIGPDPYVWAMYVLLYAALGLVALAAAVFGGVQMSLGMSPTALYVAPGAAVLAGFAYGASFVGQGLASDQIYFLRSALTDAVAGTDPEDGEPATALSRSDR